MGAAIVNAPGLEPAFPSGAAEPLVEGKLVFSVSSGESCCSDSDTERRSGGQNGRDVKSLSVPDAFWAPFDANEKGDFTAASAVEDVFAVLDAFGAPLDAKENGDFTGASAVEDVFPMLDAF